ncbi:hypothetical protein JCM6882_002994 [Rhodosporidiobolus microsporus]
MTLRTLTVGNLQVGKVATGLMRLTHATQATPDDQVFELMKTAIDCGSNFFNSATFYGPPEDRAANLKLLRRFCDANPEYKGKFVLSVKGGLRPNVTACGETDFLREEISRINDTLGFTTDFYEMARVDCELGIEQSMKNLVALRDEGLFKYISLSEVGAQTIKKAAAVSKVDLIEVEYSPFCIDIEKNGVLAACKELDIPILAYSPLGSGFFGTDWKSKEDIPEGDLRRRYDRFSDENFDHNLQLAHTLQELAKKKGITAAQLAIAWIGAQWEKIIPLPGSTKPARVRESAAAAGDIVLSPDELKEIRAAIDGFEVKGVRFINVPQAQASLFA